MKAKDIGKDARNRAKTNQSVVQIHRGTTSMIATCPICKQSFKMKASGKRTCGNHSGIKKPKVLIEVTTR